MEDIHLTEKQFSCFIDYMMIPEHCHTKPEYAEAQTTFHAYRVGSLALLIGPIIGKKKQKIFAFMLTNAESCNDSSGYHFSKGIYGKNIKELYEQYNSHMHRAIGSPQCETLYAISQTYQNHYIGSGESWNVEHNIDVVTSKQFTQYVKFLKTVPKRKTVYIAQSKPAMVHEYDRTQLFVNESMWSEKPSEKYFLCFFTSGLQISGSGISLNGNTIAELYEKFVERHKKAKANFFSDDKKINNNYDDSMCLYANKKILDYCNNINGK